MPIEISAVTRSDLHKWLRTIVTGDWLNAERICPYDGLIEQFLKTEVGPGLCVTRRGIVLTATARDASGLVKRVRLPEWIVLDSLHYLLLTGQSKSFSAPRHICNQYSHSGGDRPPAPGVCLSSLLSNTWVRNPLLGNYAHYVGSAPPYRCQPLCRPQFGFSEGWLLSPVPQNWRCPKCMVILDLVTAHETRKHQKLLEASAIIKAERQAASAEKKRVERDEAATARIRERDALANRLARAVKPQNYTGPFVKEHSVVRIVCVDTGRALDYWLGTPAARSAIAPMAVALMGKHLGAIVDVQAPGGSKLYEVISISPAIPKNEVSDEESFTPERAGRDLRRCSEKVPDGHSSRDHGQFGSFPEHDSYDDEASP